MSYFELTLFYLCLTPMEHVSVRLTDTLFHNFVIY